MENQNKHLTDFDEELEKVPNLKWLPWIGHNFCSTGLLLIGDSFYEDSDEWLEDKFAARHFVYNQGLSSFKPEYSNRKFFQVIEKTVLNQADTDFKEREKFWVSSAYFNLVQRILPSRQVRPQDTDFDLGWTAALNVAEILRPKICIKLGIDGIGRLGYKMANENPGWTFDSDEFYRRPFVINLSKNNYHLKIIFINHPTGSFGFDYVYWADILNNVVPDLRQTIKG
jgi:hypothetical protein